MAVRTLTEYRVGCAGWAIPKNFADRFPEAGSHLERYASVFNAVEINSSFKQHHKPDTYARWAETVPAGFKFSVKCPQEISHVRRLHDCGDVLDEFLEGVVALGRKLGPLLVQLPPSLAFEPRTVRSFFRMLRSKHDLPVVCEPRHKSWFDGTADALLRELKVARAAADPPRAPGAERPAGWNGAAYVRLHGAPRMYYSPYTKAFLKKLAAQLEALEAPAVWSIFDNTAEGHAVPNALDLMTRLARGR